MLLEAILLGMLGSPAGPSQIDLDWESVAGCPTRAVIEGELEALLRRGSPAPGARATGHLERDQGAYVLHLEVEVSGRRESRELRANDCTLLSRAGLLVVAVTIDALAIASAASETPWPALVPEVPIAATTPAATTQPRSPTSPEGTRPREGAPRPRRTSAIAAGVSGGASVGMTPGIAGGIEGELGWRLQPVELLRRAIEQGSATEEQRRRTWGLIVMSAQWKAALPSASTLAASSARSVWLGSPLLTVATVLVGTLGVAAVVSFRAPAGEETPNHAAPQARQRAPRTAIGPAQAPVSGVVPSVEVEATTAEPDVVDPSAPAEVGRRPAASQRIRSPIQVPPPQATPSAVDPDAALVGAMTTLQRAREDIARGRARAAITALDELGARFGTLERERRRLELDAACRLGDSPRALRAASTLAQLGAAVGREHPCRESSD